MAFNKKLRTQNHPTESDSSQTVLNHSEKNQPLNDTHQFRPVLAEIEEQPMSPIGRTLFWLVVAVALFFIIWSCLGKVDIVVTGHGKIIPDGNIKILQPLQTGVISSILIRDGDFVRKGQTLMTIDPSTTQPALESDRKSLAYARLEAVRIKSTLAESSFVPTISGVDPDAISTQRQMHDAALSGVHAQLQSKQADLTKITSQLNSAQADITHNQALLAISSDKEAKLRPVMDIIARDDYDKVQNDILAERNKLDELMYTRRELLTQQRGLREDMANIRQEFRKTLLQELGDVEKRVTELSAKVDQTAFANARQTLMSPVDGYVDNLQMYTVGGVVTPAQKLLSIVPGNMPLMIKATLLSRDAGFVKIGMPVSLKLDTFDFQKYGLLHGKVIHVSNNSRDDQKMGPVYEVLIQPTEHTLIVDNRQERLSPGMSLQAEIQVGKRRIIEFFIYPIIKYLDEGISVR